jgi:hypothetical protein
MRATQFVRRGLIAFAAVATLSVGFSGVAGAQQPAAFPENSPGAVIDAGDAIVFEAITGYVYDIVYADGARSAILAVGVTGGEHEVVVLFLPEFTGAAIVNPALGNLIAERASGE